MLCKGKTENVVKGKTENVVKGKTKKVVKEEKKILARTQCTGEAFKGKAINNSLQHHSNLAKLPHFLRYPMLSPSPCTVQHPTTLTRYICSVEVKLFVRIIAN